MITKPLLSIIVPYRNREEHLKQFLPAMTEFLEKSFKQPFEFVIVEQSEGLPFNRAMLLNIGSRFAMSDQLCFHDVDMLPVTADYSHADTVTHLASQCSQFGYKMPYGLYVGGVLLMPRNQFVRVNGYSNRYWGWGAEDDEMYYRCCYNNIQLDRRQCRYESLAHDRPIDPMLRSRNNSILAQACKENFDADGLTQLKFDLIERRLLADYPGYSFKVELYCSEQDATEIRSRTRSTSVH